MGVKRDQIPDGIESMHKCAVGGMADSYNELTTGGVIVRIDVLGTEDRMYPELTGIETVWLIYKNPDRREVVL